MRAALLGLLVACAEVQERPEPRCAAAREELEESKVQLVRAQAAAVEADKGTADEAEEASHLNREAEKRYSAAKAAVKRCAE